MGPKPQRKTTKRPAGADSSRPAATSGEDSADNDQPSCQGPSGLSEDFESFVRVTLQKLVDGQRQLEEQLGASIEFNSERIVDLEKARDALEKTVEGLKSDLSAIKGQLERQQADINKQERFSRRNNFRLVGLEETKGENCTDLVRKVLMERFGWESEPQIERAHRDGRGKNGKPAHVLVKMLSYQSKVKVLKARRTALEGSSMYVLDDLTAADRQEKNKWQAEVKALYEQGTKLRFFAGKWRRGNGVSYDFKSK